MTVVRASLPMPISKQLSCKLSCKCFLAPSDCTDQRVQLQRESDLLEDQEYLDELIGTHKDLS